MDMNKLYQVESRTGQKFYCRPNTFDEGIIRGYIDDYSDVIANIHADETWLDIGAHIGGFTAAIAQRAKRVVAIEADPETTEVLKLNVVQFPNVEVVSAAVVGRKPVPLLDGEHDTVSFYQSVGGKFGAQNAQGSLLNVRGRKSIEVPYVLFEDLVEKEENVCVKMDIEGGEREILDSMRCWSSIRRFLLEYHRSQLCDMGLDYYRQIIYRFQHNFKLDTITTTMNESAEQWSCYIYGAK